MNHRNRSCPIRNRQPLYSVPIQLRYSSEFVTINSNEKHSRTDGVHKLPTLNIDEYGNAGVCNQSREEIVAAIRRHRAGQHDKTRPSKLTLKCPDHARNLNRAQRSRFLNQFRDSFAIK